MGVAREGVSQSVSQQFKSITHHADRVAGATRKPETVGDYGGSRGFGTSKGSGAVDDGIVFEYP